MIKYIYEKIKEKDLKEIIKLDNSEFSEYEVYTPNIEDLKEFIKKFPKSICIIKDGSKFIGYSGVFPTNNLLMNQFLENKISEKQLIQNSLKEVDINNFRNIYLGFIYLLEDYRNRGIGIDCLSKQVNYFKNYFKDGNINFFAWTLSSEGQRLGDKLKNKENIYIFYKSEF